MTTAEVNVEIKLLQTVSRPFCLCVGLPSVADDQTFVLCLIIAGFLTWSALSEDRMDL
jgi:hypothetical protein